MSNEWVTADDGVRLGFERLTPSGARRRPVLLVHGFGSSRVQNWKSTGWFAALTAAGYPVLAMDCRGHGVSDKPHDEQFYGHARMAKDVLAVMDAAGIAACDLIGYSMGGFIGIRLAAMAPDRLARLCLGGVGEHYLTGAKISSEGPRRMLSAALLVEDKSTITDPRGRMFRDFADQPGKDRIALAACMRAMSPGLPWDQLARIQNPVLVVCGEKDEISGPPGPLAGAFRHGVAASVPGRDHMSAVGDPKTRQAVLDFLEQ